MNEHEDHVQELRIPVSVSWMVLALVTLFAAILAARAMHYFPFLSDDSLISLRYARRLLQGQGLTWTDGIRVEGYSNLLWILLVSSLGVVGVDLIDAARLLGILAVISIFVVFLQYYFAHYHFRTVWFPVVLALLFLSLSSSLAIWAIGGLETPLVGLLVALCIAQMFGILDCAQSRKKKLLLSLTLGLLCVTRPDGAIFTVASFCAIVTTNWVRGPRRFRMETLFLLVFPAILYGAQFIFRVWYYGDFVPNVALVKLAPSLIHFLVGLQYLKKGILILTPFSSLGIIALFWMFFTPRTRVKAGFLLTLLIAWSGYVAFIGGDIFPAYRQLIPLIVIFGFAVVEGIILCIQVLDQHRLSLARRFAMGIGFSLLIPYTYIQVTSPRYELAYDERWEWLGKELGTILKRAFATQQPLLAVTAAGCLPYWSDLPSLDMLGLNDYYLPRNPPDNFGEGPVAHELGDGEYVLGRAPDLIVFHTGWRPVSVSGEQLDDMPEFHKRYVPTRIQLPVQAYYVSIVYVDKYSKKIGIRRSANSIEIPGFLFAGENTLGSLNHQNKFVSLLSKEEPVSVTLEHDKVGPWSVQVNSPSPDRVQSEVRQDGNSVTVELSTTNDSPIEIEEVVLRPVTEDQP